MPRRTLAALALLAGPWAGPVRADMLDRTYLVDVRMGSAWAGDVRAAARGGYELADGTPVSMRPWYSTTWPTMEVVFLTELGERTGILWGLSTGERGEKYSIRPGLMLGFMHRVPVGRRAAITLRAETMLGGDLREEVCIADYGAIGGVQPVNCRLAATLLAPEDTLDYLMRRDGWEMSRVSFLFEIPF